MDKKLCRIVQHHIVCLCSAVVLQSHCLSDIGEAITLDKPRSLSFAHKCSDRIVPSRVDV
jgi:hypothetical protein